MAKEEWEQHVKVRVKEKRWPRILRTERVKVQERHCKRENNEGKTT